MLAVISEGLKVAAPHSSCSVPDRWLMLAVSSAGFENSLTRAMQPLG